MRVVVLGAGAMGSWLGAFLSKAGHHVTLVGREEHVAAVAQRGLRVTGKTDLHVHPKAVTRARDADVPDLLVVSVKAYDTARALQDAAPILGSRTAVLSLQNGLGNVERLAEAVDERRAFAAVTTHGVTHAEPGVVEHAGTGYLRVGSPYNEHARAAEIVASLQSAGLDAEFSPRILGEVWAKVVVNCAINPLTAITGLRNGALLQVPALRELMQRAAEEAIDVARAEGAPLPDEDMVLRARRVAELTAANKSSMLQDVERGRRTEIDALCGEIVQRGIRHGIDAPVNMALTALVKGIEESTRRA
ncbi:MAG TPA: 2-dehydropantoate 2-reductase [Candidatus Thermoplasmatota archaeon]|nr:2-dehydropantoate 2-reductase [Candidatus Thermoplasmatota archaeon]